MRVRRRGSGVVGGWDGVEGGGWGGVGVGGGVNRAAKQRKHRWVAPPCSLAVVAAATAATGAQLARTPRLCAAVRGRMGGKEGSKGRKQKAALRTRVCILVTDNSQEPHSNIKTVIKPHCGYRHITWSVTIALPMVVKKSLQSTFIHCFQIICPSHSFPHS